MVYSPRLTFIANHKNPTGIGLAPGETICFDSLEFIANRFDHLNLSPEGDDPGAIFVGMMHSGHRLCTLSSRSPPIEMTWPQAKGEALDPPAPRVQHGDPNCPHHHHIATREHASTPNHPDGHGEDRRTATKCRAPSRAVAGLSGGAASVYPHLEDQHRATGHPMTR
jgi:hypothetical protein